jgi:hypothetical protein
MLNIENLSECDLSTIDVRGITPKEWEAVKGEVVRRAHAERAKVLRQLAKRLRCWWGIRKERRGRPAQIYISSRQRALYWSGRI